MKTQFVPFLLRSGGYDGRRVNGNRRLMGRTKLANRTRRSPSFQPVSVCLGLSRDNKKPIARQSTPDEQIHKGKLPEVPPSSARIGKIFKLPAKKWEPSPRTQIGSRKRHFHQNSLACYRDVNGMRGSLLGMNSARHPRVWDEGTVPFAVPIDEPVFFGITVETGSSRSSEILK